MATVTRATQALAAAGVRYTIHVYPYDPAADRVGLQAAVALGEPPEQVFKTLIALVDGKPACVMVPSNREVSMKKLAAALRGKSASMMAPAAAERLTGYKVGGISPFAQMRRMPMVLEAAALGHEYVYLNGGQRGLQVRLAPADVVRVLGASVVSIVAAIDQSGT